MNWIIQQANHDGNHDFTTTLFMMKRNCIEFNSIFSITRHHGKMIRQNSNLAEMNEAETRAEHIDPKLKEAGWGVIEGSNKKTFKTGSVYSIVYSNKKQL